MENYLVRRGFSNGRAKSYYFSNFEEALKKAKELQKRNDNKKSLIIKGTFESNQWNFHFKDKIEY